MSPTTSPSPDPKGTERKLYNLKSLNRYRTDTTRSDERPGCLSAPSRWGPLSSPLPLYYKKPDWAMLQENNLHGGFREDDQTPIKTSRR
jgi:hypothetical protein